MRRCGPVLAALGQIHAKFTAAHAAFLRPLRHPCGAMTVTGTAPRSPWLAAMTQMTGRDARAAVGGNAPPGRHPAIGAALAAGAVLPVLRAGDHRPGRGNSPPRCGPSPGRSCSMPAIAGAALDDLKILAAAALERWRSQHPGRRRGRRVR